MKSLSFGHLAAVVGWLFLWNSASEGLASTLRTQTIQLQKGWNAVFLEVYPDDSAPSVIFADTPVDIAAATFTRNVSAQFMIDPGTDLFRQAGWGVWYGEHRPDAFLRTLHAIYGQQAYLIHSRADFTWQITGSVVPPEVEWQPNAYNLVGFSVAAPNGPTFGQFFAGSKAHRHNRIYRLANGTWRRVTDPSAETMRSGEAFWIYCDGPSRYLGPLGVETATRRGLLLGLGAEAVTLRNQTDHPIAARIEHVVSGTNGVPLSIVIQAVGDPALPVRLVATPLPNGGWSQALPPLEAGRAVRVPFEARQEHLQAVLQASLLKVSSDLGTEVWIPVVSLREDLRQDE
jgi:hypothetical protein